MNQYEALKKRLARGWNTWNTRSVLSHVLLPSGFALNLGLKEWRDRRYLKEALIGRRGVAGLALYAGLVLLVFGLLDGDGAGLVASGVVIAGLAGVIAGAWRESGCSGGERLLVVLIEVLETLIKRIEEGIDRFEHPVADDDGWA